MNLKLILLFIAFVLAIIGTVLAVLTDAPDVLTLWGLLFGTLAFYLGSILVPASVNLNAGDRAP